MVSTRLRWNLGAWVKVDTMRYLFTLLTVICTIYEIDGVKYVPITYLSCLWGRASTPSGSLTWYLEGHVADTGSIDSLKLQGNIMNEKKVPS